MLLKKNKFEELCKLFQDGDDSLVSRMKYIEESGERRRRKIKELLIILEELTEFYEAFFHYYNIFLQNSILSNSVYNENMVKKASIFADYCVMHINRINNQYLMSYTIKVARMSIILGVWSIFIGFIGVLLAIKI